MHFYYFCLKRLVYNAVINPILLYPKKSYNMPAHLHYIKMLIKMHKIVVERPHSIKISVTLLGKLLIGRNCVIIINVLVGELVI